MPLPVCETPRTALHTRTYRVDAYAREDGLVDLEAELVDVKGYDFPRSSGEVHRAGRPVHHMHLRVTIDERYTIVAAQAAYDAAPYAAHCAAIGPDYTELVGMNLLRGFRQAVKERFGRTRGCTHLSELAYLLPTVAVQSSAGKRRREQTRPEDAKPEDIKPKRPFELEGCHALRLDGPVAREFYPLWYRPYRPYRPAADAASSCTPAVPALVADVA